MHRLKGVEALADPPEREARVASQDYERERAQKHGAFVFLHGPQEHPLPLPTLLLEGPAPQEVELEEDVVCVLGWQLLPDGGPRLRLRLRHVCISSTLEKSNPERLSSR